ncbi:MAG TPA: hypothetical protein VLJ59_10330 [Mycobacteriales bacterium]|nr:hypothetical protein [Mycobacteriales bacterium]
MQRIFHLWVIERLGTRRSPNGSTGTCPPIRRPPDSARDAFVLVALDPIKDGDRGTPSGQQEQTGGER